MKKVFIHAYAAGNLGDDLLIRILCERYPRVQFRIFADHTYKERFKDICNLSVYSPEDRYVRVMDRIAGGVKHTDRGFWKWMLKTSYATVHIGGSVFVQHQDDFADAYRLDAELCARSKRIFVVGANFGPYEDERYLESYRELFIKYKGISFRDRYSAGLFPELPQVRYAPDVVFNYHAAAVQKQKHQVLFSVIDMKNRHGKWGISQYDMAYKRFIARLADGYLERGYEVKFISFCRFQGDEEAIKEIRELMGNPDKDRVTECCYDQNLQECIGCFSESEIVIGTRFHSIILGWLMGKKVLPIIYDLKTKYTLEDNDCPFYLQLGNLNSDVEELIGKVDKLKPSENENLIAEAAGQFRALDHILRG